jgi:nicotinamide mononucleotide transporter
LTSVHLQLPSITEIFAFITGAICVWLLVKENIWSWPIGIANNLFYVVVFWWAKLYADMGLQFFYIAISIYGWWNWLHHPSGSQKLRIIRIGLREGSALILIGLASTTGLYQFLHRFTDSTVPLGDGLTTAMSLVAQYMLSRKHIENWYVWIAADIIYIGLYTYKQLYLTSLLYLIFMIMCIMGVVQWRKSLRFETNSSEVEVASM